MTGDSRLGLIAPGQPSCIASIPAAIVGVKLGSTIAFPFKLRRMKIDVLSYVLTRIRPRCKLAHENFNFAGDFLLHFPNRALNLPPGGRRARLFGGLGRRDETFRRAPARSAFHLSSSWLDR